MAALLAPGCFTTTYVKTAQVNPPMGASVTLAGMVNEGGSLLCGEGRIGVVRGLDIGVRQDGLATELDLRLQILDDDHGAPVDLALEYGAGVSGWTAFRYGGVYISRDFGTVAPVIGFRYLDGPRPDSDDVDDALDEDNNFAEEVIDFLLREMYPVRMAFVGVEIDLADRTALIAEVVYIPDFDDYVQFNIGMTFKLW